MAKKLNPDTFMRLARQGVILDVRTPAEFAAGHIPGACNLPLFTDQERAEVGTLYVRTGRDQAVLRGLEFVGPRMADMVRRAGELAAGREIFVYCWRGGMRSGSVAWLLETAGLKVSLLEGGYKAWRRSFEVLLRENPWRFVMLGGPTGCGKTELLHRIGALGCQVLDLEGLASHRGSAFGALGQRPQPTTEHFINLLNSAFRAFSSSRPVWCEGESLLVGHVFIPQMLYDLMRTGIVVGIDMESGERLDRLEVDYGDFPKEELAAAFGRISRRMGPEKVKLAQERLDGGDVRGAAALALDYYDKAYARSSADHAPAFRFTVSGADMQGSAEKLVEKVRNIEGYGD